MALEATHIRFALDLMSDYQVQDVEKYISGAIYPDSRYVTGIDRNLTHGDEITLPEFAKDDFRKGWQAHQICDDVQNKLRKELFPELFADYEDGSGKYIVASALKIIQDMNDLKSFDLQNYLKYLDYAYNPNGEKVEDVKRYNQIMIDLYENKKEVSMDEYYKMWRALGVDEELGNKIILKTKTFLKDQDLVKRIQSGYDEMIKSYKERDF